MTADPRQDRAQARQARMAAAVVVVAMLLWLAAQTLGPELGLHGNYAILFDLMALAAFLWSFVVAVTIWRRRRQDRQG